MAEKVISIDWNVLGKGKLEDLKFKINKLEEKAKKGSIGEFVKAVIEYDQAYHQATHYISPADSGYCRDKVKQILNYISSRGTDKYWDH